MDIRGELTTGIHELADTFEILRQTCELLGVARMIAILGPFLERTMDAANADGLGKALNIENAAQGAREGRLRKILATTRNEGVATHLDSVFCLDQLEDRLERDEVGALEVIPSFVFSVTGALVRNNPVVGTRRDNTSSRNAGKCHGDIRDAGMVDKLWRERGRGVGY